MAEAPSLGDPALHVENELARLPRAARGGVPGAPDQALQDCPASGRLQAEAVATAPLPKPALRLCVWCAPDQALQDCPTSGRLHAEAVAMAPRPQRRSRSLDALKRCNDDPHIIAAVAQLFWNDRKVFLFFGIVLALRPAAPFPVWLTPACMVRAPRPRRPPNVLGFLGFMDDALKRCNDDPHIIAAVAQLFWNERKVFFGIVLALRPAACTVWLTPACMVRAPPPASSCGETLDRGPGLPPSQRHRGTGKVRRDTPAMINILCLTVAVAAP